MFQMTAQTSSNISPSKTMVIVVYRIHANKPPPVYKKIKVLRWRIIEIFPKFAPKKPQKVDFLSKKVVVYLNFVKVVV